MYKPKWRRKACHIGLPPHTLHFYCIVNLVLSKIFKYKFHCVQIYFFFDGLNILHKYACCITFAAAEKEILRLYETYGNKSMIIDNSSAFAAQVLPHINIENCISSILSELLFIGAENSIFQRYHSGCYRFRFDIQYGESADQAHFSFLFYFASTVCSSPFCGVDFSVFFFSWIVQLEIIYSNELPL